MTSRTRQLRVAVIGAGMAGILAAIRLRQWGITDVAVYEKADRIGGTWRENTYPGVACDVPSHLYCYSFEPNPEWSHLFSPGAEINDYFQQVADGYGVTPLIRLGDEVTSACYDDGRWRLETAGGYHDVCDVIIAATGVLHHPNVPHFGGEDSFTGALFHSARWDHDVELDGRRIGVIGTGSTAVQITGALVERAERYSLFQRTAQWVLQTDNRPYTDDEKVRFRQDEALLHKAHDDLSKLFADNFSNAVVDADSPQMKLIEQLCEANLTENVADPDLRELLRPDYRAACKRLVISPDFYAAVQRPNVEVVTAGIEHLEPGGVRTADGMLHELDVVVLATGFQVDRFMRPMDLVGRGGVRLDDVWAERPTAYLSVSIPDFPNLFMLNGPNGPVGNFSLIEVAELQMDYIGQLIERLRAGEVTEISACPEATAEFDAQRVEAAKNTVWTTGCRSWYLDDRGIPATWPWTFDRFREVMAEPELDHYEAI
ncbi:MAG TPA: NAD(P)/FAD-dependent oxidoreductase [Acidimicrobiales bacterium]